MGWEPPNTMVATENGSYIVDVQASQIIITGTGTEVITGNDSIKVQTIVTADAINSIIIN